jgi:hypothetical protein
MKHINRMCVQNAIICFNANPGESCTNERDLMDNLP